LVKGGAYKFILHLILMIRTKTSRKNRTNKIIKP
jgi:hypothetical protein